MSKEITTQKPILAIYKTYISLMLCRKCSNIGSSEFLCHNCSESLKLFHEDYNRIQALAKHSEIAKDYLLENFDGIVYIVIINKVKKDSSKKEV